METDLLCQMNIFIRARIDAKLTPASIDAAWQVMAKAFVAMAESPYGRKYRAIRLFEQGACDKIIWRETGLNRNRVAYTCRRLGITRGGADRARCNRVYEARKAGRSYRDITAAEGVSHKDAVRMYQLAYKRRLRKELRERRKHEQT